MPCLVEPCSTGPGIILGGATELVVCDTHGGGPNFLIEKMDPRPWYETPSEFSPLPSIDGSFDGLILMCHHAMAGTQNGFLDHTQSSMHWFDYKINGESYGEIGQETAYAGHFGVPLIMVTGDGIACAETQRQRHPNDGLFMTAHQAVELAAVGQSGKGAAQMPIGIAKKVSFRSEDRPLAEDGQGHHFAATQRGDWPRTSLGGQMGFAEIIHRHVQFRQEGVELEVEHRELLDRESCSPHYLTASPSFSLIHTKR
jgi:hypothetical protein